MSKSFKSPLTGSRRKRVRPARAPRRAQSKRKAAWIDALDAIDERCRRIETLAGLLRVCDEPHAMHAGLAASAGYFIEEDLRQAKELLAALGRRMP
jgi:hypothetical protein